MLLLKRTFFLCDAPFVARIRFLFRALVPLINYPIREYGRVVIGTLCYEGRKF